MSQYINKDILITEIERLKANILQKKCKCKRSGLERIMHQIGAYNKILSFLDTLEAKDVDTWHLQEKEDIYDAVKGWDIHTFVCIMKDGTIQKFTGCRDEDYEGCITTYIDGVNDDYDDVDDIVKWIEV